jgi:hypothetical protein
MFSKKQTCEKLVVDYWTCHCFGSMHACMPVFVSVHVSSGQQQQQLARSQRVLADGVISVCEEHEDSVYSVEWSCADPWIYASLSYDGRLVISRVPRTTKYQILL